MIYRPQFAYSTPEGFEDYDFDHFFSSATIPALNPGVGNPREITNIPLPLDPDADFCWRGLKIPNLAIINGASNVPFNVALRFREPNNGRYLQSAYLPIWMYGLVGFDGTDLTGGIVVAFESEIVCPAAANVMVDQLASVLADGSFVYLGQISLVGAKRYKKGGGSCNA